MARIQLRPSEGERAKASTYTRAKSLAWLDTPPLRVWFANWLCAHWEKLFDEAFRQKLMVKPVLGREASKRVKGKGVDLRRRGSVGVTFSEARMSMKRRLPKLLPRLSEMSPDEQLAKLQDTPTSLVIKAERELFAAARKCDPNVSEAVVQTLFELECYLKDKCGQQTDNLDAYRASPWFNSHAVKEHFNQRHGGDLPSKHYPENADLRVWFETVVSHFRPRQLNLRQNEPALFDSIGELIRHDRQHAPQALTRIILHALHHQELSAHQVVQQYIARGRKRGRSKNPLKDRSRKAFEFIVATIQARPVLLERLILLAKADETRLRVALESAFRRMGKALCPSIEDCLVDARLLAAPKLREIRRQAEANGEVRLASEIDEIEVSMKKFRKNRGLPPLRKGDSQKASQKGGTLEVLDRRAREKTTTSYGIG